MSKTKKEEFKNEVAPEERSLERTLATATQKTPILIPLDDNTVTRSKPTLELKDIVGKLRVGTAYRIKKAVTSVVYGEFYQLDNNLYVTKAGNYSVKG